jgi:hypothetical protein
VAGETPRDLSRGELGLLAAGVTLFSGFVLMLALMRRSQP